MKICVVKFPGSNCDLDTVSAFRERLGADVDLVWHAEPSISNYGGIVLPGGFSYGDYLRAGAIAARSPALAEIREAAEEGKPVLGICNGFQILCEAGLLPGSIIRNTSLRFICRWVRLRVEKTDTCLTRLMKSGEIIPLPIAHNEGRFFAEDEEILLLTRGGQIVLRYVDVDGRITKEANPNGSVQGIGAVSNESGNVVGLMPHPERASFPILSPFGSADGARLLKSFLLSTRG